MLQKTLVSVTETKNQIILEGIGVATGKHAVIDKTKDGFKTELSDGLLNLIEKQSPQPPK